MSTNREDSGEYKQIPPFVGVKVPINLTKKRPIVSQLSAKNQREG